MPTIGISDLPAGFMRPHAIGHIIQIPNIDSWNRSLPAALEIYILGFSSVIKDKRQPAMIEMSRQIFIVRTLASVAFFVSIFPALSAQADNLALPSIVPPGTKLVVGDQNENLQTLMTASGVKGKLISKVQFANFLGGPEIFEAFRAGALDVALVGNTPPIHAHAAGEPFPIVAALKTARPAYRFALRPGLTVSSLQELKGKKIAWAEGTARQPFVLNALKNGGLTPKDVKLVPLKVADFPTAIKTGQVDVAPLNEPHFSRYLTSYAAEKAAALPESAYQGFPTSTMYLYASKRALADPAKAAAIRELVAGWVAAVRWAKNNPNEWINAYYVRKQGLKESDGLAILKSEGELTFPQLKDTVSEQQEAIDLIYSAGQLPKRLDAREEFDFRFDPLLAEQTANAGAAK
jgi:sulfonate transport system substrate-binding protein